MPKKLLLLVAFLKKEYIITKRYAVNALGGLLTMYVIFLGAFYGLRAFAVIGGDTAESLAVGYVLWIFLLTTYQDLSYTLQTEAQEGTLEQLSQISQV